MVSDTPEEGERSRPGLFCMIGNYVVDGACYNPARRETETRGTFLLSLQHRYVKNEDNRKA